MIKTSDPSCAWGPKTLQDDYQPILCDAFCIFLLLYCLKSLTLESTEEISVHIT